MTPPPAQPSQLASALALGLSPVPALAPDDQSTQPVPHQPVSARRPTGSAMPPLTLKFLQSLGQQLGLLARRSRADMPVTLARVTLRQRPWRFSLSRPPTRRVVDGL
ncbi:hypothetical protein LY76DRAFT_362596 [Colletotrichum caudatum]|nr:hypothetical protein LY76DRAFT_362596 [Colletotrichum caudatum]